jgi:hypothetical protein
LTHNLASFAAEVVRRLSGVKTETSPVFNLNTQFGGGKTHFLTLLYHLASQGSKSGGWSGVSKILERASAREVPKAAVAVFVGQRFDATTGRGGDDGTPRRLTPWGEIAFQLGGKQAFAHVAKQDADRTAPGGDVIAKILPKDKPCLILVDEFMNFVSSGRKLGMASQTYNFLQNLSEEARSRDNTVLAVSIPASELEMNPEDTADYQRLDKMLDRLGKAVVMSAEGETSEIIRRRLFDWDGLLDVDAKKTTAAYASWVIEHRQQVPNWFPIDQGSQQFEATYPFHPAVLSVFERKWQALPRFQRTRGILRLLALWVSRAYSEGYKGAHKDAVIGLGTAPLEDSVFRSAIFEQLGESLLEAAVTTDISGKKGAHAVRLDKEADEEIRKARLHRKVATVIFFESNGGQIRGTDATIPEVRLAVAEPDLDIGNIDTVIENLSSSCYYLSSERNRFRFGLTPNLNKLLADRRASIKADRLDERIRNEVRKLIATGSGVDVKWFPEKSIQIPNQSQLTLVVLPPEQSMEDEKKTLQVVESLTRQYGAGDRTFKSALVWCIPDSAMPLVEEARKLLAWEDIQDEADDLHIDQSQIRQLNENVKKSQRDLREAAWRTYKHLVLLGKDNELDHKDLGLITSSSAADLLTVYLTRLRNDGDIEQSVSPVFLVRRWPGMSEWSTKAVRDAFFASPRFPRLLNPDSIRETIARGVENKVLAHVGKDRQGRYDPFHFGESINAGDVEISEEMFIITGEEAKKHIEPPRLAGLSISHAEVTIEPGKKHTFTAHGLDQHGRDFDVENIAWTATGGKIDAEGVFQAGRDEGNFIVTAAVGKIRTTAAVAVSTGPPPPPPPPKEVPVLTWEGEVPPQRWMNFYTKVLSRFAGGKALINGAGPSVARGWSYQAANRGNEGRASRAWTE